MARKVTLRTPEETVEMLAKAVREGKMSRQALLRELMKLGLEEQKRWKAIRHFQNGKVDIRQAAEIAGLDEEDMRALMER